MELDLTSDHELEEDVLLAKHVLPGDRIASQQQFLRGHGTYVKDESLVACQAGKVVQINSLVQVIPTNSEFRGEVGDVIVGKIFDVESTRWKVDINSGKLATLHLGSVNLPDGELRRTTNQDAMQMRQVFKEHDLLSAEISKVMEDGRVSIHTRSLRYGHLTNGILVTVQHNLIKRVKNHFVSLATDDEQDSFVSGIFGLNGLIFLSIKLRSVEDSPDLNPREKHKFYAERRLNSTERQELARVRNCIKLLELRRSVISPDAVLRLYRCVQDNSITAYQMLLPKVAERILSV